MANRTVDKRRYYFSIAANSRIIDAITDRNGDSIGRPVEWHDQHCKAVWAADFKLYNETEGILAKAEDPNDFSLWPLYRGLGTDDDDYIFSSRQEALDEYERQIGRRVDEWLYDL